MSRTITHQFTFGQTPEEVWQYLTNPELLAQWLMPNDFKPVAGHRFQFGTKPLVKLGFDGRVYGEVLEVIPFERLVYSWRGGMSKEKPLLDSVVTWTLTKTDSGTILKLEHRGFKGIKNALPYFFMKPGWKKIGGRLFKLMNH